jgi:hypothetical protein
MHSYKNQFNVKSKELSCEYVRLRGPGRGHSGGRLEIGQGRTHWGDVMTSFETDMQEAQRTIGDKVRGREHRSWITEGLMYLSKDFEFYSGDDKEPLNGFEEGCHK